MYNSFFGFSEKPFNVTPDPRFYYANRSYQEAYASLLYGIQECKGFVVLTGEVGVGKTTLLRRVIGNLGDKVHISFLYNTNISFDELLADVCNDFGLDAIGSDRFEKIKRLNAFLTEQLEAGEVVALLIDEAQNLRVDVMEELRVLSNLETSTAKLLQIILVGQPELDEKLNRQDLRQLKQRIAIRCRLKPLEQSEVGEFIQSRLANVGYQGPELFLPGAVRRIAACSEGLPRLINNICDNSLLVAFALQEHVVTEGIVEEVARDLELGAAENEVMRDEPSLGTAGQHSAASGPMAEDEPFVERGAMSGERGEHPAHPPHEGDDLRADTDKESDASIPLLSEQRPTRRIGRIVSTTGVVLALISLLFIANPYQLRERLAQRGFSTTTVEEVIQYLEQKLSSGGESVERRAQSVEGRE